MIVCNLTKEEHYLDGSTSTAWFLPTMFAQYALDNETSADAVMEMYQGIFMGKVEFVRKIFVSISDKYVHRNDNGNWVANWMKDYDWDDEYDKISVNFTKSKNKFSFRMRLAIDLVLNGYNELRDDVIKRVEKTWKGF
ncbi:hypothetical protein SESBI_13319 [Sesbania bispinosa]|nr:hypothetical protein SESBI_13319 [Sesbania bispinosa]